MKEISENVLIICDIKEPTPLAFANLYEVGDLWKKIKGCTDCPPEQRKACCGTCPMVSEVGCFLHMDNKGQNKPFHCVVHPLPNKHRPSCVLEYECIEGSLKGKVHRAKDPKDVFV